MNFWPFPTTATGSSSSLPSPPFLPFPNSLPPPPLAPPLASPEIHEPLPEFPLCPITKYPRSVILPAERFTKNPMLLVSSKSAFAPVEPKPTSASDKRSVDSPPADPPAKRINGDPQAERVAQLTDLGYDSRQFKELEFEGHTIIKAACVHQGDTHLQTRYVCCSCGIVGGLKLQKSLRRVEEHIRTKHLCVTCHKCNRVFQNLWGLQRHICELKKARFEL